jgi:hypothetical protein
MYRNRVDPNLLQGKYKIVPNDDVDTNNTELANQVSNIIFNPYFAPLMVSDEELGKLPNTFLMVPILFLLFRRYVFIIRKRHKIGIIAKCIEIVEQNHGISS